MCTSLESAIKKAHETDAKIFVIGGGELYKEALPLADKLYLTLINEEKDGDVFFPAYEDQFTKATFEEYRTHNDIPYTWIDLERA